MKREKTSDHKQVKKKSSKYFLKITSNALSAYIFEINTKNNNDILIALMAVIILSMVGWYSTESICVKQMDCNWCAVYPCDFFWWPIRLFTQWKHVKTSAFKQVVTAKRYCLEIQAVNTFFSCFGQRLCMALLQKEINKIAEFI